MTAPLMQVKFDEAKLRRVRAALAEQPKALPRIVYRALKRTAAAGRTQLDKGIRQRITARKKDVMNRIVDEEKASYTHWLWRLGISGKRLALTAFPHTVSRRRGVRYRIRPGMVKQIPEGFSRQMKYADAGAPSGETYEAIFRRARRGEKSFSHGTRTRAGTMVRRYPLVFLRGPSLGQVVEKAPDLLQQIHAHGQQRLEKEIMSQVDHELQKGWPA